MKAYIAFARSGFLSSLAYRNEVWANIFGKLVQVFARVAIWLAAYAGLTAVDGATILSDSYELLGFGAKIGRRKDTRAAETVRLVLPFAGLEPRIVDTAQLGGTRHLSAAQFVHDQPGTLALVASQDGRFTVFAGDPEEDIVHAHRVEALLL